VDALLLVPLFFLVWNVLVWNVIDIAWGTR